MSEKHQLHSSQKPAKEIPDDRQQSFSQSEQQFGNVDIDKFQSYITSSSKKTPNKQVIDAYTLSEGIAKKLTDLESELVKEKAIVQVISAEKETLENQLKQNMMNQSNSKPIMHSDIKKQLQEKDQKIFSLQEQLTTYKSQTVDIDSTKINLHKQLNETMQRNMELEGKLAMLVTENERLNYRLKDQQDIHSSQIHIQQNIDEQYKVNMQLEQKIAMLAMENERLNFRIKEKDKMLQNKDQEFKTQLEKLRQQYEEKIIFCESKLNNMISENEKTIQANKTLEFQISNYEIKQKQMSEQFDKQDIDIREQWKQFYEKKVSEFQEKGNVEKDYIDSQLKHSKQLNQELELKINSYLQQIDLLKKEILSRDKMIADSDADKTKLQRLLQDKQFIDKQNEEFQQKLTDATKKNKLLQQDNQSLQSQIEQKIKEIELWQRKYDTQQQQKIRQIEELQDAHKKDKQIILMEQSQILDSEFNKGQQEKENLLIQIVVLKLEIEKLQSDNTQLQTDLKRMKELEYVEEENIKQKQRIIDFQQKIKDYEGKIDILINDNESINNILTIKNDELMQCKEKIIMQDEEYTQKQVEVKFSNEKQIQKQMEELKTIRKQYEDELIQMKTKLVENEMDKKKQNEQLSYSKLEKAKLQEQLSTMMQETDNLHKTMRDNFKETEMQKDEMTKLQVEFKLNIDEMDKRLQQETLLNTQKQNKISELQSLLQMMQDEATKQTLTQQKIEKNSTELMQENNNLVKKITILEEQLKELEVLRQEIFSIRQQHDLQIAQIQDSTKHTAEQEIGRILEEKEALEQKCNMNQMQLETFQQEKIDEQQGYKRNIIELQEAHNQEIRQLEVETQSRIQSKVLEFENGLGMHRAQIDRLQQINDNLYKDNETLKKANDKLVRELELLQAKQDFFLQNNAVNREAKSKIQQLHYDNYKVMSKNNTRRISEADSSQYLNSNMIKQISISQPSYSNQNTNRRVGRAPSIDQYIKMSQRQNLQGVDEKRRMFDYPPEIQQNTLQSKYNFQDADQLNKKILDRCKTITQSIYY